MNRHNKIKLIVLSVLAMTLAVSGAARAEVITLQCGSEFFTVDLSAGSATEVNSLGNSDPVRATITADEITLVIMFTADQLGTNRINRTTGIDQFSNPGGSRGSVQCQKAPNKSF